MEIVSLAKIDRRILFDLYREVFAAYYYNYQESFEYQQVRWEGTGVDWNLSFGVIENSELIAFQLIGEGKRRKKHVVYLAATGVQPVDQNRLILLLIIREAERRLHKKNFDFAILQTLEENSIINRLASRWGFEKWHRYHTLEGEPNLYGKITANPEGGWKTFRNFNEIPFSKDVEWSWEQDSEAVLRRKRAGEGLVISTGKFSNLDEAWLVFNPQNGKVLQSNINSCWSQEIICSMLKHLKTFRKTWKFGDIPDSETDLIRILKQFNFEITQVQTEYGRRKINEG